MDITSKTNKISNSILKYNPRFLEEIKLQQKLNLFENLPIEDDQPVVLTFNTITDTSIDPLATTISTQVKVEYPIINHVVLNKCVGKYTEHKSFWQKLKLLFSKKPIYTKETKEI